MVTLTPNSHPLEESSGQEWYYCSSACLQHVCQAAVLSDVQHPPPLNAPRERHLVAKSGTYLGPVHMSSCAIVCNRLS